MVTSVSKSAKSVGTGTFEHLTVSKSSKEGSRPFVANDKSPKGENNTVVSKSKSGAHSRR